MKNKTFLAGIFIGINILFFSSCATINDAYDDLNSGNIESLQLMDFNNTNVVVEYLQEVASDSGRYEIKAYNRNPFTADHKKNIFVFHCYYGIFKDGEFQHTIGFSQTPGNAVYHSCWILDKIGDMESIDLYFRGTNEWNVEEYVKNGCVLDTDKTVAKIMKKINKMTKFWGASSVRDFPWYMQILVWTLPIPVIPAGTVFIGSIGKDNCSTTVLETMVWKKVK